MAPENFPAGHRNILPGSPYVFSELFLGGNIEHEAHEKKPLTPGERLDSWKEISQYLRRTVRTVQRWEQTEGLPVHRIAHEKRSSVYAFPAELDRWWVSRKATKSGRLIVPESLRSDPETTPAPETRLARKRMSFYWLMLLLLAAVTATALVIRST